MGLADMKMFFLSRSRDTITGLIKYKDEKISDLIEGGAEAVRAIKGTSISARSPPSDLKDVRKSSPLIDNI